MTDIIPLETVASKIYLIRGMKVMLDSDLAELYGVTTKRLNEQVRRNQERFPEDFMVCLTREEYDNLKSQIATSSQGAAHGGRRHLPFVFSEHGAIMAATVLNSQRAVTASIFVVRAFVQLREMLASHKELAGKLATLENRLTEHDDNFKLVFEAIRNLLEIEETPKRKIGF
jgi:hypothetical protein